MSIAPISGVKIVGVARQEGLTGPCAKEVAKNCDRLRRFRWMKAYGDCRLLGPEPEYIEAWVTSGRLKEIAGPGR